MVIVTLGFYFWFPVCSGWMERETFLAFEMILLKYLPSLLRKTKLHSFSIGSLVS